MSRNRDYMKWFQQHSEMMGNLSRTISPALQIAERAVTNANYWNSALVSAVNSAAFRIPEMEELERVSSLVSQATESVRVISSFAEKYANAMEFLNRPAILESFSYLQQIVEVNSVGVGLEIQQLSRVLEACQVPYVMDYMGRALTRAERFDVALLEEASYFDMTSVSVEADGKIVYNGDEYGPDQIDTLLTEQIETAEKSSIPERAKTFQKKYWLLLWLLRLAIFLPTLPGIVAFYNDAFAQIQEMVNGEEPYCFTIRERSMLRQEANSKSKVLQDFPAFFLVLFLRDEAAVIEIAQFLEALLDRVPAGGRRTVLAVFLNVDLRSHVSLAEGTVGVIPRDAHGHQRPEDAECSGRRDHHHQSNHHKHRAPEDAE